MCVLVIGWLVFLLRKMLGSWRSYFDALTTLFQKGSIVHLEGVFFLQMYSCGSLAPKMGRGRSGGCMDHQFRKPSEPWELADGYVWVCTHLYVAALLMCVCVFVYAFLCVCVCCMYVCVCVFVTLCTC